MPTISICHYDWSKVGNTLVNNDTRWPKPGSSMGVIVITVGPWLVIHWCTNVGTKLGSTVRLVSKQRGFELVQHPWSNRRHGTGLTLGQRAIAGWVVSLTRLAINSYLQTSVYSFI